MAKLIALCLLVVFSLIGCQAISNKMGSTLTAQLNKEQAVRLIEHLAKDNMTRDVGSDSVIYASSAINLGLTNYLIAQPLATPITIKLNSKDGLPGYGSVSWQFADDEEGHQTFRFKTNQVNELIKVIRAWQATDETAQ